MQVDESSSPSLLLWPSARCSSAPGPVPRDTSRCSLWTPRLPSEASLEEAACPSPPMEPTGSISMIYNERLLLIVCRTNCKVDQIVFYCVFLCGSVVEHCVSCAKGCGFDSQGTHILMKMLITWMHCKSLWINASAKCINVNVCVPPSASLNTPSLSPLLLCCSRGQRSSSPSSSGTLWPIRQK